jgi:hypothetical protein
MEALGVIRPAVGDGVAREGRDPSARSSCRFVFGSKKPRPREERERRSRISGAMRLQHERGGGLAAPASGRVRRSASTIGEGWTDLSRPPVGFPPPRPRRMAAEPDRASHFRRATERRDLRAAADSPLIERRVVPVEHHGHAAWPKIESPRNSRRSCVQGRHAHKRRWVNTSSNNLGLTSTARSSWSSPRSRLSSRHRR